MDDFNSIETISIERYVSTGGYKALKELKPEGVIKEVKSSGLRGRGGAGFPTWRKWEFVAGAAGDEKYLCCNAAEGEQGTFKDRCLIRSNPHQLIEWIIIASYAVGARKSYLYITESYSKEITVLEKALQEAKEKRYIG